MAIIRVSIAMLAAVALVSAACAASSGRDRKRTEEPVVKERTTRTGPAAVTGKYTHGSVNKELIGDGADAYWRFTPADPTPSSAPVILFLHGWRGVNPRDYGGWIDHLARSGNIVLYPIFEKSRSDTAEEMMVRAIATTKRALAALEGYRVAPELDKFAITGHSLGGGMTAQIAGRAQAEGLPVPRAIMPAQPGWKGGDDYPADALASIPASVLLLVVDGADDGFDDTRKSGVILEASTKVPDSHKAYAVLPSDEHGDEKLVADHSAPMSPNEEYGEELSRRDQRRRRFVGWMTGMDQGATDALDYWGFWRLFDELREAAYAGKDITAVTEGEDAVSLGTWPDGTPRKRIEIKKTP